MQILHVDNNAYKKYKVRNSLYFVEQCFDQNIDEIYTGVYPYVAPSTAGEIHPIRGDFLKGHAPKSAFSGKQFLRILQLPQDGNSKKQQPLRHSRCQPFVCIYLASVLSSTSCNTSALHCVAAPDAV